MTQPPKKPGTSRRGFASMTPEKQREIATKGGKAVKPESRSFSQSRDLAREAGRKGGKNVDGAKRSFSTDSALASSAGAKGGAVLKERAQKAAAAKEDRS